MSDDEATHETEQYYIRARGKVRGPFTVEQLRSLRAKGRFSRAHQVSTDRKSWQPASTLEDVFAPGKRSSSGQKREEEAEDVRLEAPPREAENTPPAPSADPVEWYFYANGQQQGPMRLVDLQQLIATGQVRPEDMVWKPGFPDWMPVANVPELRPPSPQGGPIRGRQAVEDENRNPGRDKTDAPGVVSLIFGCVAAVCVVVGCFTFGITYLAAMPLALVGVIVGFFGRGNLKVAGITLNLLVLVPAIILAGLVFIAGMSAGLPDISSQL